MKVMIVGGSGNISTYIVRLLVKKGHEVVCFNRGVNTKEDLPECVRQVHGDRGDREKFEQLMRDENPDAAIDMIAYSKDDALSDLRAFPNVKKFIFCSTVCVFGTYMTQFPVKALDQRIPDTAYGVGKGEAEDVFTKAFEENQFPVAILRPSTTYGNQVGMVSAVGLNNVWLQRIEAGKPIFVPGSGNNLHQYMHVADVAKAFVMALEGDASIGKKYNIVASKTTDWNEYTQIGMKLLDKEVPVIGIPLDLMKSIGASEFGFACDIFGFNSYYSNEEFMRDFPDYKEDITLEDGMKSVIEWNKANGTADTEYNEELFDKLAKALLELREIK